MKTLLYDGDCSLCLSAVGQLKRLGLLKNVQDCPWNDFEAQDPALAERIRSEFLLLEPDQVYGGFEAISRLLEGHYPWTSGLFGLPGVQPLGQMLYKTVSLNRRILAPTGRLSCACDPPFHRGYRAGLWGLLLFVAFAGSAVFGSSLALIQPEKTFLETAWQLTVGAGSGWALNFLVFLLLFRPRYWEFVQQCLVVMAVGIVWLMPVALVNWLGNVLGLPNQILLLWTILGVTANSLIMFLSLRRRSTALGFPTWVPWLWLFLLELAGIPLFILFKLFTFF